MTTAPLHGRWWSWWRPKPKKATPPAGTGPGRGSHTKKATTRPPKGTPPKQNRTAQTS